MSTIIAFPRPAPEVVQEACSRAFEMLVVRGREHFGYYELSLETRLRLAMEDLQTLARTVGVDL